MNQSINHSFNVQNGSTYQSKIKKNPYKMLYKLNTWYYTDEPMTHLQFREQDSKIITQNQNAIFINFIKMWAHNHTQLTRKVFAKSRMQCN